jgi:endonuclease YncB( thermonuclease family)
MQKIMNSLTCVGSLSQVIPPSESKTELPETKSDNPIVINTSELHTATYDSTPIFSLEGPHNCKVLDIYDGDTFTVAATIPGQGICRLVCRLTGIDTAEMKYSANEPMRNELKQLAYKARNRIATELIDLPENFDINSQLPRKELRNLCGVSRKTVTVNFGGMDKYGRLLVEVPVNTTSLSQILIDEALALPYEGGTKRSIHELLQS